MNVCSMPYLGVLCDFVQDVAVQSCKQINYPAKSQRATVYLRSGPSRGGDDGHRYAPGVIGYGNASLFCCQ